jgi:hypothetical protein
VVAEREIGGRIQIGPHVIDSIDGVRTNSVVWSFSIVYSIYQSINPNLNLVNPNQWLQECLQSAACAPNAV